MSTTSTPLGPVANYLPHRPPMLLIDRIDEVTPQTVVCSATIRPTCVFAQGGVVHPSAMIELVAQACAIFAGLAAARDGGSPRVGVIASCREVSFAVDSIAVGDELTIVATQVVAQERVAAFTGTVSRGGEVCMSIELSVVERSPAEPATKGHVE